MTAALLVDAVLAALVLGLAVAAMLAEPVRVAVGAFIALGAVVAVLWARLGAPDVALAEAVIGAGLTGALLLRHLGLTGEDGGDDLDGGPR
ncbi:MAG: hydrogenase subunit MbhD domain-containing protein [Pseudomonadota bacterium]